MSKKSTIWIIIAAFLVVIGTITFTIVMSVNKWEMKTISTDNYEKKTYDVTEDFGDIDIQVETDDICFVVSTDGKCKVECYENENEKHSVSVSNNTLTVKYEDNRKWYDHIGIHFETPKITIYLTKTEFNKLYIKSSTGDIDVPKDFTFENVDITLSTGDVDFSATVKTGNKIGLSTGDINIKDTSAGTCELRVSTGKITIENFSCDGEIKTKSSTGAVVMDNVKCASVDSYGTTGRLDMEDVLVSGKIYAERSTGDIYINNSDAAELYLKTSTGHVKGSLLTDKVYITDTSNGNVDVPKSVSGGKCEIVTSTGNISFK